MRSVEQQTELMQDAVRDYLMDGGDLTAVLQIALEAVQVEIDMEADGDDDPILITRLKAAESCLRAAQRHALNAQERIEERAEFRAADRQIGDARP
jgi:hypothetical protein